MNIADELKELLQNVTGKEIDSSPRNIAGVLNAYNALYVCKVTFNITPSGATLVVKKGSKVIDKNSDGTYHLKEGSYTYSVSADGYSSKNNQSLTITNSDETTGTKTVNVTLTTCVVTFETTPATATIVVKKGTQTITPNQDGTYNLPAGSYTYDATAEGYTSKTDQSLVISSSDETTGTKTVSVTLSEAV